MKRRTWCIARRSKERVLQREYFMCSHSSGLVGLCSQRLCSSSILRSTSWPLRRGIHRSENRQLSIGRSILRSFLFLGGTADLVLVFLSRRSISGHPCGRRRMWSSFLVDKLLLHRRRFRCIVAAHFAFPNFRSGNSAFPPEVFEVSIRTFLYFEGFLRVFRPGVFSPEARRDQADAADNNRG